MMKVTGVIFSLALVLHTVNSITVKPNNKQAINDNSHVDLKKTQEEDRVVRYTPLMNVRSQLDNNLNLVRYLQSLPKANLPQIPSIAYLYGGALKQTPQVQSGFIYKARPDKDSYPVSATMFPIYNQPGNPAGIKYQQLYNYNRQKPISIYHPKTKIFTPFLPSNVISGAWQPINSHKPLYTKGHVHDIGNEFYSHVPNDESQEDFISITKQPYKFVSTTPPSFTKKVVKYDTKPITILNPESHSHAMNYEQSDKSLPFVTSTTSTEKTNVIEISSSRPTNTYEFEEQIVYELNPNHENKTAVAEQQQEQHEYLPDDNQHDKYLNNDQQHEKYLNNDQHDKYLPNDQQVNGNLPPIPYEIEHAIKPHANFTRITPVPNVLNIYQHPKPNPEINDAETDYYDSNKDDYDDVIRDGSPGPNSGRPGVDYPNFHQIPETSFSCKEQRYKGFFGDPATRCQVWHYCDLNGGKSSFLCPNGTIFSQTALTCDWWFNVKCNVTAQLYVLNERLYKFILPFQPKFPQDFQGPLVDKYLALKFKEMEEELEKEKEEKLQHEATIAPVESEHEHENEADIAETSRVEETTDNTLEDFNNVNNKPQLIESTESPSQHTTPEPLTSITYTQPMQSIEADVVDIHNPGTSGHLSPLIYTNLK